MLKLIIKTALLSPALLLLMLGAAVSADAETITPQCEQAPVGVPLDKNGCPCDNDGDGVANFKDRCPSTPAGWSVDELGCKQQPPVIVAAVSDTIDLQVHFATDKAVIRDEHLPKVEKLAAYMQRVTGARVVIEGHTDDRASRGHNQRLSQRRADAVKQLLVEQYAIEAERLRATGYGEDRPMMTNDSEQGRQQNRRVMAVLEAVEQ